MINEEKNRARNSSRITFITKMNKRQRLSEIAGAYGKNISSVINEVLDHYIELHKWQLKHITRGVKEPGSGKFVKEKEVEDFFKSHT